MEPHSWCCRILREHLASTLKLILNISAENLTFSEVEPMNSEILTPVATYSVHILVDDLQSFVKAFLCAWSLKISQLPVNLMFLFRIIWGFLFFERLLLAFTVLVTFQGANSSGEFSLPGVAPVDDSKSGYYFARSTDTGHGICICFKKVFFMLSIESVYLSLWIFSLAHLLQNQTFTTGSGSAANDPPSIPLLPLTSTRFPLTSFLA